MGEFADMVLDGDCCEACLEPFEDAGIGHPRTCDACKALATRPPPPRKARRRPS